MTYSNRPLFDLLTGPAYLTGQQRPGPWRWRISWEVIHSWLTRSRNRKIFFARDHTMFSQISRVLYSGITNSALPIDKIYTRRYRVKLFAWPDRWIFQSSSCTTKVICVQGQSKGLANTVMTCGMYLLQHERWAVLFRACTENLIHTKYLTWKCYK